jgi:hypothetical protein
MQTQGAGALTKLPHGALQDCGGQLPNDGGSSHAALIVAENLTHKRQVNVMMQVMLGGATSKMYRAHATLKPRGTGSANESGCRMGLAKSRNERY